MELRNNIRKEIIAKLHALSNPKIAQSSQRFFKTGIGEYGFGDVFIGVTIPQIRTLAKQYVHVDSQSIAAILHSKIHEERLLALTILVEIFTKSKKKVGYEGREKIVEFYLDKENLPYINNWDLVDSTAYKILGTFLLENMHKVDVLQTLANSENMWEKRIAIVSTLAFIKVGIFTETLVIAKQFLHEKHDLLHKATGWMLREIGKKNQDVLIDFLRENHKSMPRVMLSYAMEKLTNEQKITIKTSR